MNHKHNFLVSCTYGHTLTGSIHCFCGGDRLFPEIEGQYGGYRFSNVVLVCGYCTVRWSFAYVHLFLFRRWIRLSSGGRLPASATR